MLSRFVASLIIEGVNEFEQKSEHKNWTDDIASWLGVYYMEHYEEGIKARGTISTRIGELRLHAKAAERLENVITALESLRNFQDGDAAVDVSTWSQSPVYREAVKKIAPFYLYREMRKIHSVNPWKPNAKEK